MADAKKIHQNQVNGAELTQKIVILRMVTERFPQLLINCFGEFMPIPRLKDNSQPPSQQDIINWNNQTRTQKEEYLRRMQPFILLMHSILE